MSVTILQTISMAAFVLAGIFAMIAVILWFRLDIRGVMDELSGKKEELGIQELRKQNVQQQNTERKQREQQRELREYFYGNVSDNLKSGKLTKPLGKKNLQTKEQETISLQNVTVQLEEESSTTLLEQEEGTTVLGMDDDSTTVLGAEEEGTTVLAQKTRMLQNGYKLVLDEIVVHTEERIL